MAIGAWNPAILTPNGIRRRLFKLENEIPIAIEVNLDEPQQYRVVHQDIGVVVTKDQVTVDLRSISPQGLQRAAEVVVNAIESLEQTPLRAAGVNLRYVGDRFDASLREKLRSPLDDLLEGQHLTIASATKRSLEMKPGLLNLDLREETERVVVEFNFHLGSTEGSALCSWLRRNQEFYAEAGKIMSELGIETGEG